MIRFLKTNKYEVKSPIFNLEENAGIDIFIPENTPEFKKAFEEKNYVLTGASLKDDGSILIPPNGDVLIPSGLYTEFPNDMALIVKDKSGIATKYKLKVGACVIDSSYQGISHIHLFNMSSDWTAISCGMKITQMVPVKLAVYDISVSEDLDSEQFFTKESSRGDGGFGSTGV